MSYRSLSNSEIAALQSQGCFSSDWSEVSVSENFSSDHIHNVRFLGEVKIGKLGGDIITDNEEKRVSGLFNCKINSCELGNDILIENVHEIKNYHVKDRVIIENVDSVAVSGPTSFGNGFEVEVLNEGGGRELMIFDRLSAQLAYILTSYRHDPDLIESIHRIIKEYARNKTSETGTIGTGTKIVNTGSIDNVNIGSHATIRGASLLKNGTIVSNGHAPVYIGENVIAKNFIVLSGSEIDGGALVDKSFVGQGVEIGKQFSAENSVFFANSEAFHGEAVSLFAGPYLVTHHKSSALIAGMFSFFNTGSGTNQSNHMYKLGPVHQGIVERGSKTGSFAYMLWPSHIGAYSVVMGKNTASFDTSDFPFSYINVDHDKSFLTPGMNLFSVGTWRDNEKWPQRDKRKDPEKTDLINFDFLSPYIMQKVIRSLEILKELYEKTSQKQESIYYKGIRIKRLLLKSTQKYYQMALSIFIGNQIVKKLDQLKEINSLKSIRRAFSAGVHKASGRWIDLAGMIAPENAIQDLFNDIKTGKITDLDEISSGFEKIHASYESYNWDWSTRVLSDLFDIDVRKINAMQLIELVSGWEHDSLKLDKMILNDAGKEYDDGSKIGFGIDGDAEVVNRDFNAVRGLPEDNKFIIGIKKEMEQIEEKAARLKSTLGRLL
jgi:NDP-sugar pyrophosphorylase family protein